MKISLKTKQFLADIFGVSFKGQHITSLENGQIIFSSKMSELSGVVSEYDSFFRKEGSFKDNDLVMSHSTNKHGLHHLIFFDNDPQDKNAGGTSINHIKRSDEKPNSNLNDYVALTYSTNKEPCSPDISFNIDMKTGVVFGFRLNDKENYVPATDEQVDTMIFHIKRTIGRIESIVARNMVDNSEFGELPPKTR